MTDLGIHVRSGARLPWNRLRIYDTFSFAEHTRITWHECVSGS